MPQSLPLSIRVVLWRLRRAVPLVVLVLLGLLVAGRMAPSPEPTAAVVVTARAVAAGEALADRDLRVVRVPTRLVPDDAEPDPGPLTGQEVLITLPRGVPVVRSMLADGRFDRAAPPGTVTVPVQVDGVVAGLLRPGDRIDLVVPSDPSPVVLARGALVLDVVAAESAGLPWGGSGADSPVTVVAVSPEEGHRLAGAGWDSLGAVLVAGS